MTDGAERGNRRETLWEPIKGSHAEVGIDVVEAIWGLEVFTIARLRLPSDEDNNSTRFDGGSGFRRSMLMDPLSERCTAARAPCN